MKTITQKIHDIVRDSCGNSTAQIAVAMVIRQDPESEIIDCLKNKTGDLIARQVVVLKRDYDAEAGDNHVH